MGGGYFTCKFNILAIFTLLLITETAQSQTRNNLRVQTSTSQTKIKNISTSQNSKNSLINYAGLFPNSGQFFKQSNFTFKENQNYKLTDLFKEGISKDTINTLDMTITECGLKINVILSGENNESLMGDGLIIPYYDYNVSNSQLAGSDRFLEMAISITDKDLERSYITFTKGSAENCNGFNTILVSNSLGKDKLTYTIQSNDYSNNNYDNDDYNNKIILERNSYNNMKTKCNKLNLNELEKIKNLLIASTTTSSISTAGNIATTTMGAINMKEGNDTNSKLNLANTIVSGINTATSGASAITGGIAISKLKEIIENTKDCKEAINGLIEEIN